MGRIRQNWKFGAVAASCLVIGAGAGASMIASAGAATTTSSAAAGTTATPAHHCRLRARRLLGRTVHGDFVVATKNGFVTITVDRGRVQSVNGQQLTLTEGTKTATYKTVIADHSDQRQGPRQRQARSLGDVKAGQRATVVQGPQHTWVIARDVKTG